MECFNIGAEAQDPLLALIVKKIGGYKEDGRINSLNLLGGLKEALGLSMCANCATNARKVQ